MTQNKAKSSPSPSDRGRDNQQKGAWFEQQIADLYRLLHYDVEHGRLFEGRQVDLFLAGRFGDLAVYRAIECKAGPVTTEHVDKLLLKLQLVRRQYPSAQGTIVAMSGFTDAVTSHAAAVGIQLTEHRDLQAHLFDAHNYVHALLDRLHQDDAYRLDRYVEPTISPGDSNQGRPAFGVIDEWINSGEWNQLTLLGDIGTGKSFLTRMLAFRLARAFNESSSTSIIPVLVDLRHADRHFTLESLILTHLAQMGTERVTYAGFSHLLSRGRIALILDGFDEMAAKVTPTITTRNFHELARAVKGSSKTLLTCRTQYFRSRKEEEDTVRGSHGPIASESARDLYWDLVARKGFSIAYLQPFSQQDVRKYVVMNRPDDADSVLERISNTYNLGQLSHRPLLLDMIVKAGDRLGTGEVTAADLYSVFTDAWMHREQWREVMTAEDKLDFCIALARSMWETGESSVHHSRLKDYLRQAWLNDREDPEGEAYVESEIRTATFLTRDARGYYGFVHKSYGEYFLARHVAKGLNDLDSTVLATTRFTQEVAGFITDMMDYGRVSSSLEQILCDKYIHRVSENALVCMYVAAARLANREETAGVPLPRGLRLRGAVLDQVDLSRAVLQGADLRSAQLTEAVLVGVDLMGGDLSEAVVDRADLGGANLSECQANGASFEASNLKDADLSRSDLGAANLRDTYCEGANFNGVRLIDAVLGGAVLPSGVGRIRDATAAMNPGDGLATQSTDPDIAAFWEKYVAHRHPVERLVRSRSLYGDVSAEDVIGELPLAALRRRRSLDKYPDSFLDWLVGVASSLMSRARERSYEEGVVLTGDFDQQQTGQIPSKPESEGIDELRTGSLGEHLTLSIDRMHDHSGEQGDWLDSVVDGRPDALRATLAREAVEMLRDQLQEEVWQVVRAYYGEGLSMVEIATARNLDEGRVRSLLRMARRRLRQILADSEKQPRR